MDFDFFLDSERTVLEDQDKDYWLRPEMLLDAHPSAPRTPVVHHRECLRLWDQAALRGWVCVHFDAHPDLFDEADPGLGNLSLGRRGDYVTDGNYLLIALRDGILARVVWVLPDWQAVEDYRARFDHSNPELADRVEMLRYRDFLASASARWVPQRINGAFSPGFIPFCPSWRNSSNASARMKPWWTPSWRPGWRCISGVRPWMCRRFERASEALAEYGVRVYVGGARRIHHPGLLELATRHRRAVEAHFEMRLPDILALPFFASLLHLFFVARGVPVPGASSSTHTAAWLRWLERELAPRAYLYSQQPASRYHGFEHSVFVARAMALLALKLDRNPLPAMIAGLLHDAGRRDDAALGADIAALVLKPWLGRCLDAPVGAEVVEAIRRHAEEGPAAGDIAACLRDADRLRLAWERGFDPHFFTTPAGAEFARVSPTTWSRPRTWGST